MQKKFKTAALLFVAMMIFFLSAEGQQSSDQKKLDPAAWGENHVGKPIPEYVTGDECLFCHRNDIGPTWPKNPHGRTVRPRELDAESAKVLEKEASLSGIASEVEYFLGSRNHMRLLKKEGYGKFALLNAKATLDADGRIQKWSGAEKPVWNKERFADRCAGCHTTAVDSATKSFRAFGLDCYTCHGDVTLEHTKDISLIWLSKKRRSDEKAITSICAQCHIRNGKARSTGLPYPNNFIAGDNLFQDFEVDFSKADDESLNAGDRHILRNVRDVVVFGSDFPTCITCHDVHNQSSFKHRRAPRAAICADCHNAEGSLKEIKRYTVKSDLCEY